MKDDKDNIDWVERMLKIRQENGWSQKDLARELRVTPGAVGLWESRARSVSGPVTLLIEIFEERIEKENKRKSRIKKNIRI